jgi:hypothetical protein
MIVDGCLPEGGLGAIVALPGVGKSLVAIELARCVAAGDPFAGRPVRSGMALYFCPDSPASTERRMLAIPEAVASRILSVTDSPLLPTGLWSVRAAIARASTEYAERIRLVVVDTYDASRIHATGGYADQDANAEAILGGLRPIALELGVAIVLVHHATRRDRTRARGSLVFDARADWIAVLSARRGALALSSTKNRDGDVGPIGAWRIVAREIGGVAVPTLVSGTDRRAARRARPLQGVPAEVGVPLGRFALVERRRS